MQSMMHLRGTDGNLRTFVLRDRPVQDVMVEVLEALFERLYDLECSSAETINRLERLEKKLDTRYWHDTHNSKGR